MRGSGKTLLLAVLAYLESVFKPFCGTTILGGSLEQSQKAIMYSTQLWERPNVPKQLLAGIAGRGYQLKNGSWVQALAASQKSVRGPHPQRLRLDEVDEMAKEIFDASLGQPKANFNIPDQKIGIYCFEHKKENMIDVSNKTCLENNCKNNATHGFQNKRSTYCFDHKKENMINNFLENK